MVMRFRCGGAPSSRFHVTGIVANGSMPQPAPVVQPVEDPELDRERTTWFTSSLELRDGLEVCELTDDSIDRIVL